MREIYVDAEPYKCAPVTARRYKAFPLTPFLSDFDAGPFDGHLERGNTALIIIDMQVKFMLELGYSFTKSVKAFLLLHSYLISL